MSQARPTCGHQDNLWRGRAEKKKAANFDILILSSSHIACISVLIIHGKVSPLVEYYEGGWDWNLTLRVSVLSHSANDGAKLSEISYSVKMNWLKVKTFC